MPAIRRVTHLGLVAAAMMAAPAAMAQAPAQPGFATIAPQQSQAEQLRHWRVLAERGNAEALFELGNAYRLGRGVPQDLDAAEAFYARAARNNHVEAQGLHGLMLIQRGAQEDGLAEVERAARRGDARARYVLGTALFYGDGLTRDRPRALELMAQAAAGGFAPARELLDEMQQEMAASSPPPPAAASSPDGPVALAETAPSLPPAPRTAVLPPAVPPPPVGAAAPPVAAASESAPAASPPPVAAAPLPAPAPMPAEMSPPPAPLPAAPTQQAETAIEPPTAAGATPAQALVAAPAPAESAPPAEESAPTPAQIDAAFAPAPAESPPPAAPVAIASAAALPPPANPPPAPLPAAVEAAPVEAPPPALATAPAEPSATSAAAAPAQAPAAAAQPTPAAGGWRLQLGAFRVDGNARRAWQELGPLLPGLQPHFAQQGELTLLQAGPLADRAAARRACAVVRGAGLPCLPWGPPGP
jgi:hypothetical protein